MTAEKLTKIVKIVTSLATAFVVLMVGIIVAEYIFIGSLNKKIDDITTEMDNLSQKQSELQNNIDNMDSDYIEDYARRELGMLKDGEHYVVFE